MKSIIHINNSLNNITIYAVVMVCGTKQVG